MISLIYKCVLFRGEIVNEIGCNGVIDAELQKKFDCYQLPLQLLQLKEC